MELVLSSRLGMSRVIMPSMSSEVLALTLSIEKVCTLWRRPPRKNAVPSTSSKLESTEPRSESCTTRSRPERMAKMQTIISVALPKVALSRPPTVAFVCSASCSVTKPSRSARGQSASSAATKVSVWLVESAATGTITNSALSLDPKSSSCRLLLRYVGQSSSATWCTLSSGRVALLLAPLRDPRSRSSAPAADWPTGAYECCGIAGEATPRARPR
mmetsp:Transcript_31274/g.73877  ORF Transcript_31274/g.73877 Transcript_31274/m.73877 type:complete len:216 (+) Transcript_31274:1022-1669(+)